MRAKLVKFIIFICLFGISPVHAEVLNMGTAEIILLILSGLFFLAFFGGMILLVYYLIRRRDAKQQLITPSSVAINIAVPTVDAKNDGMQKNALTGRIQNEKIALPQQQEIRYVFVNEIMRCEADDNYTNFYLANGERILISKSLKEYADLLTPHGFLRTHQSHLINPAFVKSWLKEDGGVLLIQNGDKIPVSKPNRESVKLMLVG